MMYWYTMGQFTQKKYCIIIIVVIIIIWCDSNWSNKYKCGVSLFWCVVWSSCSPHKEAIQRIVYLKNTNRYMAISKVRWLTTASVLAVNCSQSLNS